MIESSSWVKLPSIKRTKPFNGNDRAANNICRLGFAADRPRQIKRIDFVFARQRNINISSADRFRQDAYIPFPDQ